MADNGQEFRGAGFIPIVPYLERYYIKDDGQLITLYPHQKEFLRVAFTPDPKTYRLPFSTIIYSTVKKSGKTSIGSGILSWYMFSRIADPNDEIYIAANAKNAAKELGFRKLRKSVEGSQKLFRACSTVNLSVIETKRGVRAMPISTDYAANAGFAPSISWFDELWAFDTENDIRLWDELTPIPTRRNSVRLVTTYAGFAGQSELLEGLYKKAMAGKRVSKTLPIYVNGSIVCFWDDGEAARRMPWQRGSVGDQYYAEQREVLRPATFDRLHLNYWTTGDEGLDMEHWDQCVDSQHRIPISDKRLVLAVGVDAAYRRDWLAIMSVYKKDHILYQGPSMIFKPKAGVDIDLRDAENYILELKKRFRLGAVLYDPREFVRSAAELRRKGVKMVEWQQHNNNAEIMGTALTDCLKGRGIVLAEDADLRHQARSVRIKDTPVGMRLSKRVQKHKVDGIIALAMAIVGAIQVPNSVDIKTQIMSLSA